MANPTWDETEELQPVPAPVSTPSWDDTEELAPVAQEMPVEAEASKYSPEELAEISKTESFLRSAAQVPTLGFADEIGGAVQAGWDVATSDNEMSDLKKLYQTYRDIQRRKDDMAAEANPWSSRAGTVAGAIGTAFIPGLNGAAATTAGAARTAAALGAASGLGSSEADLTEGEVLGAAKDTAIGAGLGVAGHKAGQLLGKGWEKLTKTTEKVAQNQSDDAARAAYSSLSPSKAETKELNHVLRSVGFDDVDQASLPELAKEYTFALGGPEKTIKKVTERIDAIEAQKLPLMKQAEELISSFGTDDLNAMPHLDLRSKLDEIAAEIVQNDRSVPQESKKALYQQLRGMFDDYLNPIKGFTPEGELIKGMPRNTLNLVELDQIKRELGKELGQAGFKKSDKVAAGIISPQASLEANRRAYSVLKKHIQEVGDAVGGDIGSMINKLNNEEHLLIGLKEVAENAAATNQNAKGLGLGGSIAMGLGGAAGGAMFGPIGTAVGGAAGVAGKLKLEKHVLGQPIGSALQAASAKSLEARSGITKFAADQMGKASADFISKYASPGMASSAAQSSPFKTEKDTSNLATYDNEQLSGVAAALSSSGDRQLTSYAESLNKALEKKDLQGKNAAIFLIMQNPKARAALGLSKKE